MSLSHNKPPSERRTAFLDESGNTGSNYLDPTQPVHVLAGWLVRDSQRDEFAQVIAKTQAAMGMPELKGGRMLTTKKGRRLMLELIDAARAFAVPIYSIWEKRFCAALKVVETFLDPMHNPRASWLPMSANLRRNQVADKLLEILPLSYFERFIQAYRDPSLEGLGEIARSMSLALKLSKEEQLSWSLAGCVGEVLYEIISAERSTEQPGEYFRNGLPRNITASLSYPSFAQILRVVDLMFEAAGSRGVIVHDETSEFASSFQDAFLLFKRMGPEHVAEIEDGRRIRAGIGFVDELLLRKSQDEPLIQAADVLASAVKAQGLAAVGELERYETMNTVGTLLMTGLLLDEVDCPPCSCLASEDFKAKLMHPVILAIQRRGAEKAFRKQVGRKIRG